jgi:hypothetical protein
MKGLMRWRFMMLESKRVREGLKELLLGAGRLYQALQDERPGEPGR